MADIAALRELYAWMREARILYARCGELELRLEPSASPVVQPASEEPSDEADDERRALETLLHSSGVDAAPFLRALQDRKVAA